MCKFRDYDNYEIYADGRIWSYYRNKWLKPKTEKNGYQSVGLYDNEGKMKRYLVHRVVWEAVTSEHIPENLEINHRSEDKTENFFENLELISHRQNINFGSRNSRAAKSLSKALKGIIPKANPPKQVAAYKDGELIFRFPSLNEARRQGFNQGNISECCNGKRKTHKGFQWKYI